MKKRLVFIPILAAAILFAYITIIGRVAQKEFYDSASNSIVLSKNKTWTSETHFYTNDGLEIHSMSKEDIDIEIGDSITKKVKSWVLDVYKKNSIGTYIFNKSYDCKAGLNKKALNN